VTRIDFYSNAEPKLQFACRLTAKALRQRLNVVIYVLDETTARGIDKMLCTFQATGFIPHCPAIHPLASETPVVIAREDSEMPHYQVMLNLHSESPASFSRFDRLIELVGTDEDELRRARDRFRFYRDRGYDIRHHDLAKAGA
jgi:DNA polymerase-3 subunit chi